MEELKKVHRVVGKALPGAPHAVYLVLDATTGQNALHQAKAFQEAVKVNGLLQNWIHLPGAAWHLPFKMNWVCRFFMSVLVKNPRICRYSIRKNSSTVFCRHPIRGIMEELTPTLRDNLEISTRSWSVFDLTHQKSQPWLNYKKKVKIQSLG